MNKLIKRLNLRNTLKVLESVAIEKGVGNVMDEFEIYNKFKHLESRGHLYFYVSPINDLSKLLCDETVTLSKNIFQAIKLNKSSADSNVLYLYVVDLGGFGYEYYEKFGGVKLDNTDDVIDVILLGKFETNEINNQIKYGYKRHD